MKKACVVISLAICVLLYAAPAKAQPANTNFTLVTKQTNSLGKFSEGAIRESLIISPDNSHVAYEVAPGGGFYVVVDGVAGKKYSEIGEGTLMFSPDSKRVAYLASTPYKWVAVVDGVESKEYQGASDLVISPDSKHVAFVASPGEEQFVVLDGVEQKAYPNVSDITFSFDSQRVAYKVVANERGFVVVDGQEGRVYERIDDAIYFSPDSKHVAYKGLHVPRYAAVVDGVEGPEYNKILFAYPTAFSPDSRHLAYMAAKHGADWKAVVDGVVGKEYDNACEGLMLFSPDSRHIAFATAQRFDWFWVIDRQEGPRYQNLAMARFSANSMRFAYSAQMLPPGQRWRIIVDGRPEAEYDSIVESSLVFSPDNRQYAYGGARGRKFFLVINGAEVQSYDGILPSSLVFSSDSRWLACQVTDMSHGVKGYISVNGVMGKEGFDDFAPKSGLTFDGPNTFHFLALQSHEIVRCETRIEQGVASAR